jgi:hypothetical protein
MRSCFEFSSYTLESFDQGISTHSRRAPLVDVALATYQFLIRVNLRRNRLAQRDSGQLSTTESVHPGRSAFGGEAEADPANWKGSD